MRISFFIFCLVATVSAVGQNVKEDVIKAPVVSVNYGALLPSGNFAQRFGYISSLGLFAEFKTDKNWQFGFGSQFLLGNKVKEDNILDGLKTEGGEIINEFGEFAAYELYARGYMLSVSLAKIFPIVGPNPNSGLIVKLSTGYIRHRIKIDNEQNHVPQLNPPYNRLYDRLTHGVSFTGFFGYQHMANTRVANFFAGVEFTQGFTKGIRDYQADLMEPYWEKRMDGLVGLRVGWIVPIYKRAPKEYYFD